MRQSCAAGCSKSRRKNEPKHCPRRNKPHPGAVRPQQKLLQNRHRVIPSPRLAFPAVGSLTNLNLRALGLHRPKSPSSEKQPPGLFSDPPQFRMSLSSRRMRFSRLSRTLPRASAWTWDDATSVSLCAVIHIFNVDLPPPKSSATCCRESLLDHAIRTASLRNSSVLPVPLVHRPCCT